MNYVNSAKSIIEQVGGTTNIISLTHCMTRLRFVLKDDLTVNDKLIKEIKGVIGVVRKGGQYQVIIGNDVATYYEEIRKIKDFSNGGIDDNGNRKNKKITFKALLNNVLDIVSGSMAPLMPAIIGCGMVKLVIIILDLLGVSTELPTYRILTVIGDVGFYFLPLLLAYSAAKKFKCSSVLAVTIVAVLIHPDLISILELGNTSFLTIPVTSASYSACVIPALLTVWLLSKIEPIIDAVCKGWIKTVFKPTIILMICVPISLIIIAPIGMLIGNGMAIVLTFMQTKAGWLTLGIYSALLPLVVMTGMHYALFPYIFSNLSTLGYDILQLPAMLAYNLSQAAASAAIALRTKDKELKAIATTAAISAAVAGISEPALYGVTLRLKKPLIASMIGSGLAGILIGMVNLKAFTFASPSIMSIAMYTSSGYARNFVFACIAAIISIVVTFIMTLVLGWDEVVADDKERIGEEVYEGINLFELMSPLKGDIILLSDVKDETFSKGMLGEGIAIKPTEGKVIAPFDGEITAQFPTLHAVGITDLENKIELLVHVGIDTVNLEGEGFSSDFKTGNLFEKGDVILEFNCKEIIEKGYDITTPIIILNSDKCLKIESSRDEYIEVGEKLLQLYINN